MRLARRLSSVAIVIGSGVALGALAMSALVAAVAFPEMRRLDPSLPAYAAYQQPHWSIAAGLIAERVFHIAFFVTGLAVSCLLAGVVTLAIVRVRGRAPWVRLGLAGVLTAGFLVHVVWLQPRMDNSSHAYRELAAEGSPMAEVRKDDFDALHPLASRLIGTTTLAALALFLVSAWAATRDHDPPAGETG